MRWTIPGAIALLASLGRAEGDGLTDGITFERNEALEALLKDRAAVVPRLLAIASSDDVDRRNRAIYVLGETRSTAPEVKGALVRALASEDVSTRYVAATALAKIDPETPGYLPWLVLARDKAQPYGVSRDARQVFDSVETSVAPRIVALLAHEDPEVRVRVFMHIRLLDRDARVRLLPQLREQFEKAEREGPVAVLLVRTSATEPGLRAALRGVLRLPESEYAAAAIRALRATEARDETTVTRLIEALGHESSHVQSLAATLLGDWRLEPARTVPALIEVVKHRRGSERRSAAFALARFGEQAKSAVPALISALHERHEIKRQSSYRTVQGRSWAAEALGALGAEDAIPDLIRALEYDAPGVWSSAIDALAELGAAAAPAVPALIDAVQHDFKEGVVKNFERFREFFEGEVRRRAIRALGRIGPPAKSAVPVLEPLARDGDRDAEEALQRIRSNKTSDPGAK